MVKVYEDAYLENVPGSRIAGYASSAVWEPGAFSR